MHLNYKTIKLAGVLLFIILSKQSYAQEDIIIVINETVKKEDAYSCISYLASDEMRGRGTGTPEIDIAADYLAKEFQSGGVMELDNAMGYFQAVPMVRPQQPSKIELIISDDTLRYIEDLLMTYRGNVSYEGEMIFVGYGKESDFAEVNVAGKVVISFTGTSDSTTAHTYSSDQLVAKQLRAKENGAIALIELLTFNDVEWSPLSDFLVERASEVALINEEGYIPHWWMKGSDREGIKKLISEGNANGSFVVDIPKPLQFSDNNVIGLIEGSDPQLKDEYVVLSAHYDHIGVFKTNVNDSIHNGARDNGIGVAAILLAGKTMALNPPKRSVLIMALCAEEIDLFGSDWYVRHPLVPLNKTVYNLNCDGAGYNDKRLMTVIDFNRTNADEKLKQAARAFGLTLSGDPEPSENLYENSDNFSFALKGIPSVNIAPGVKKFNRKLMKYYHRPNDEVNSLDFEYLEKFFRAYVYASYLIANAEQKPYWKAGDKFEKAGNELYDIGN